MSTRITKVKQIASLKVFAADLRSITGSILSLSGLSLLFFYLLTESDSLST